MQEPIEQQHGDAQQALESLLSVRHRRFCEEYLVDCNAKAAAIRVGYSPRSAKQEGYSLLQRTDVQAYLSEKFTEIAQRADIRAEKYLRSLDAIAQSNIQDFIEHDAEGNLVLKDIATLPRELTAQVEQLDFVNGQPRIKLYNRMAAIEKILKHLSQFIAPPKLEVEQTPSKLSIRVHRY